MFDARKRPGRRDDQSVGVLFYNELPIHLRKPQVIADAETKTQTGKSKACERITRREAFMFFNRRDCKQVGLSIFGNDVSLLIDKNLRIVNRCAIPLRQAADDGNRKFSRDLLKFGYESISPRSGVGL